MQDTTLQVTGMTCKSCVARVNRALRELDGVHDVQVELRTGTVRIRHAPEITTEQLAERLRQ